MHRIVGFCVLLVLSAGCSAPVLVGRIERGVLEGPEHPWFREGYDRYAVPEALVDGIRKRKDGVSVLVFIGTWCGDSRREVPRFFKVADLAQIGGCEIFGLDRSKRSPEKREEAHGIRRVPTFVFLRGGIEIGRIVETPERTLEEDILAVLSRP